MTNPALALRTRRTVVSLRVLVAVLVVVHVLLLASGLRAEGLLPTAAFATVTLVASSAWAIRSLRLPPGPLLARRAWSISALDAIALVTIARVTVEVDPSATIAWAFVLWVPFSIGVRATVAASLVASAAVAGLVLASTQLSFGVLDPVDGSWTASIVPALLVLVCGVLTALAALSQYRSGLQVRRELDSERDRAMRLREADELKNTFLAAVSHELRTPLTSILGFSMTMLDRPELDEAQRERMLRTIVSEAEHLEDILANLLDLDRLTRGKATIVAVQADPAVIVRSAVEHVEQRSGRVVQLDLQPGISMGLDAAKVERIVENLVGNAVKYTPPDATVEARLRADGNGVVIRVDDDGPGIRSDLVESIFEPFRRGGDVSVPGTGIGLSLVDRFSRMHGGRAWVEERPGGGCRFQVYLAAISSEAAGAPADAPTVPASTAAGGVLQPGRGRHNGRTQHV